MDREQGAPIQSPNRMNASLCVFVEMIIGSSLPVVRKLVTGKRKRTFAYTRHGGELISTRSKQEEVGPNAARSIGLLCMKVRKSQSESG